MRVSATLLIIDRQFVDDFPSRFNAGEVGESRWRFRFRSAAKTTNSISAMGNPSARRDSSRFCGQLQIIYYGAQLQHARKLSTR